jgi:hypothetical protein
MTAASFSQPSAVQAILSLRVLRDDPARPARVATQYAMNTFGTLLWIDEKNHRPINNKNSSVHSYFRQADLLAKTLRLQFGTQLTILTNDEQKIRSWFGNNGRESSNLIQISPSISVPQGISSYSTAILLHFTVSMTNSNT